MREESDLVARPEFRPYGSVSVDAVSQSRASQTFYQRAGKRWLDLALASVGLVLLSPLLIAVSAAVRWTSPGPAFFRQRRTGQFGALFLIFKFRSMRGNSTAKGALLTAAGDPRITPLGYWLRKSKVDELPQLMNVVAGHMSLVGPRPEVPEYTAKYTEQQLRILLAKPGVTGPATNAHVNEEELLASQPDKEAFYLTTVLPAKLETDLAYCENIRFAEDVKLILTAIRLVLLKTLRLFTPHHHPAPKQF
jgi:lipopolysaccharide/colanic/teichoic acid biosynthesis glycosyltransferase